MVSSVVCMVLSFIVEMDGSRSFVVVVMVIVVDFWVVCMMSEMRNFVSSSGILLEVSILVMVLLMLVFVSIWLNVLLVFVMRMMIVVVGSVDFMILLRCVVD